MAATLIFMTPAFYQRLWRFLSQPLLKRLKDSIYKEMMNAFKDLTVVIRLFVSF